MEGCRDYQGATTGAFCLPHVPPSFFVFSLHRGSMLCFGPLCVFILLGSGHLGSLELVGSCLWLGESIAAPPMCRPAIRLWTQASGLFVPGPKKLLSLAAHCHSAVPRRVQASFPTAHQCWGGFRGLKTLRGFGGLLQSFFFFGFAAVSRARRSMASASTLPSASPRCAAVQACFASLRKQGL